MATDVKEAGRNPKRVQREVRKQVQNTGIGTKSQQVLQLRQEQLKMEHRIVSREQREAILMCILLKKNMNHICENEFIVDS